MSSKIYEDKFKLFLKQFLCKGKYRLNSIIVNDCKNDDMISKFVDFEIDMLKTFYESQNTFKVINNNDDNVFSTKILNLIYEEARKNKGHILQGANILVINDQTYTSVDGINYDVCENIKRKTNKVYISPFCYNHLAIMTLLGLSSKDDIDYLRNELTSEFENKFKYYTLSEVLADWLRVFSLSSNEVDFSLNFFPSENNRLIQFLNLTDTNFHISNFVKYNFLGEKNWRKISFQKDGKEV